MTAPKPPSDRAPGHTGRLDIVEAVLSAPFLAIIGLLFGLFLALAARLYLSGHTTLAMIVGGLVALGLLFMWLRRVLDAGTDRMAAKILRDDAVARGEPPVTQSEKDLGDVHWVLRYAMPLGMVLGVLVGAILDPLTVLEWL